MILSLNLCQLDAVSLPSLTVAIQVRCLIFLMNMYAYCSTVTNIQSVDGREKEPNLLHEAAKGLLSAGVSYARGDVEGLISTGLTFFNKATRGKAAREKTRLTKSSPADVIQFSGCKDYQKAADTVAAVHSHSMLY